MKAKAILVLVCLYMVQPMQAQEMGQIHNLTLYQFGNGMLQPKEGGSKYKFTKTNHLMFEYDWISPEMGWWAGTDVSLLLNSIIAVSKTDVTTTNIDAVDVTPGFNGGMFDFHFGFSFNNNRPLNIGGVSNKIGMGIRLGAKGFDTDSIDKAVVLFGPEIGIICTFGERLTLFTKATLSPSFGKGNQRGFNPGIDVKATVRLVKFLGLTLSSGIDSYRQKEHDTYTFKYVQLGLSVIID